MFFWGDLVLVWFFPSTSGEGSLIFQGASRSRRRRLQNREIKISLCLLHFEGCGSLDLAEIYPFIPWKRCAFDFRHPTFAYPRANHTPGAPALRIGNLGLFEYSVCFRCVLHFEGCGSLDLAEIYQFSPWKRCAFDFRHPTFAYPRANHTPGAPALRTCILGLVHILCVFAVFAPLRRLRNR